MDDSPFGTILKDALEHEDNPNSTLQGQANIQVFGVGGAGCNMVNWLQGKG